MLNAERGINKGKINQDKIQEHVKGIKTTGTADKLAL